MWSKWSHSQSFKLAQFEFIRSRTEASRRRKFPENFSLSSPAVISRLAWWLSTLVSIQAPQLFKLIYTHLHAFNIQIHKYVIHFNAVYKHIIYMNIGMPYVQMFMSYTYYTHIYVHVYVQARAHTCTHSIIYFFLRWNSHWLHMRPFPESPCDALSPYWCFHILKKLQNSVRSR